LEHVPEADHDAQDPHVRQTSCSPSSP
jgi:hypothetical protein